MKHKYILLTFTLIILVIITTSSILLYNLSKVKENLKNNALSALTQQVKDISQNIQYYNSIKYKNLKKEILNNPSLYEEESLFLSSFITSYFKNIFLLYYDGKHFRVLGDGTKNKEDRLLFNERFDPLKKEEYLKVINTKKPLIFTQTIKSLWATYLYPVVKDNKVEYIITIDFSQKAIQEVEKNITLIKNTLTIFIIVIFIVIFALIIFILYDNKREMELKKLNESLEQKIEAAKKEIKEKDEQLILQSRLALMGEILSMIAHQWRQPLNAISALITDMEMDYILKDFNEERNKERISKLKKIIKYLSSTIDDFRNFYKEESKKETIDLKTLIKNTLDISSPSLNIHQIKIKTKFNCNQQLLTYPNELKQIILNLLKNAQDILIEKKVKEPFIEIRVFKESNKCIIEIKDNGGGVPPEIKDKIFEAYFTTKDEKNGTGLGLYMSQLLIKKLKGKLTFYNDNEGAVFRIELPIE